ncbi:MAG: DUF5055 domain-containing protein [Firmicutes bacterium]|nr:DUF5055 domain-containing protein [Bacillota bacterium]
MRKLKLKINDKDYLLEMSRDSIKWLEMNGFSIDEFDKKPVTYYDMIWMSLFLVNHKDVNPNLAIKLMDSYKKSGKKPANVIKFAIEEYQAFMSALTDTDSAENEEELEIIEI